jgi:hypothetical protein
VFADRCLCRVNVIFFIDVGVSLLPVPQLTNAGELYYLSRGATGLVGKIGYAGS